MRDTFRTLETQGWNDKAEAYHRRAQPLTSWTIDGMLDAVELRAGMDVLDIGTGPGYLAASASARDAQAVGIDVAADMLALAKQLQPGVKFVEADGQSLPFADRSFDAVAGNFVVLHFGDPEQAVAEMFRVLKPKGKVALTAWQGPERARFFGAMLEALQVAAVGGEQLAPLGPALFRFGDAEEFSRLLERAGFEEVAVRELPHVHVMPSVDDVWDFFSTASVRIGGLLAEQTDEMQRRVRAKLEKLLSAYASESGLEIPADANLAIGRKPGH